MEHSAVVWQVFDHVHQDHEIVPTPGNAGRQGLGTDGLQTFGDATPPCQQARDPERKLRYGCRCPATADLSLIPNPEPRTPNP
ncbi:MAG: hypothetical protein AUH78_23485 [Gemmatimonadetes bacterium 13_1_40CM_4_69_8]|nr:MAG: hypothetical protein AUH78_23485 [Gemmatimonadetes bacterium 13_1_40CM_4_69_8]